MHGGQCDSPTQSPVRGGGLSTNYLSLSFQLSLRAKKQLSLSLFREVNTMSLLFIWFPNGDNINFVSSNDIKLGVIHFGLRHCIGCAIHLYLSWSFSDYLQYLFRQCFIYLFDHYLLKCRI